MQETTFSDGTVQREFFTEDELRERMMAAAKSLIQQRRVKGIRFAKVGRNERCPCGSGRKFKHCCIGKVRR